MPKIAISYRRTDASIAGRIHDRLAARYGKDSVFIDVNDVPIGAPFPAYLEKIMSEAQVLLALVGPNWLRSGAVEEARSGGYAHAWLTLALRYVVAPTFFMLVGHYLIVNALDLDSLYMRIASFVIPFPFGAVFFLKVRTKAMTAFAIGAILGLVAAAAMTVSASLRYEQPIMPANAFEWRENFEYVVSIALGFFAGNMLARLPQISSRFHQTEDWVRAEVEVGLKHRIPLIPVLVEGAAMPARHQVPKGISEFVDRSAARVESGLNFESDMDRLIAGIDKLLADSAGTARPPRS